MTLFNQLHGQEVREHSRLDGGYLNAPHHHLCMCFCRCDHLDGSSTLINHLLRSEWHNSKGPALSPPTTTAPQRRWEVTNVKQHSLHTNDSVSRWKAQRNELLANQIHPQRGLQCNNTLHEYHITIACLLYVVRCDWHVGLAVWLHSHQIQQPGTTTQGACRLSYQRDNEIRSRKWSRSYRLMY